jgi:DNA-binding CsgD family transcriptional regulator
MIVAVAAPLSVPAEFREQASVVERSGGPAEVSANVILASEDSAQAWSLLNPTIPVLALENREIRAVVIGGRLLNAVFRLRPGAAAEFVAGLTAALRAVEPGEFGPELTARELEVVQHLVAGETNESIAQSLGMAYGTVKAHVSNLMRKLSARNRIDAVARMVWQGFAGPAAVAPVEEE